MHNLPFQLTISSFVIDDLLTKSETRALFFRKFCEYVILFLTIIFYKKI